MELIQRKIKIKEHVIFDNQSYANMTGITEYKANNGIWWINLDGESIELMSFEYREMCRNKYEYYDAICLEENDFIFIDWKEF